MACPKTYCSNSSRRKNPDGAFLEQQTESFVSCLVINGVGRCFVALLDANMFCLGDVVNRLM